ncbi:MAG: hypothetical protein HYT37_04095 [Candidatus Sungbacteria bacterium]|nr:hypothetical protein [Candidatus Sungbacteria bacterium]
MSKSLKIIVFLLSIIVLLGVLAVAYMGTGIFFGVKSAKNANDEAIKEVACAHSNIYLRKYYETNKEYPTTFEQWAPDYVLKEPPHYSPSYVRTSLNSFTYIVILNSGKKFTITEKDLFSTLDPNVSEQCKEWLKQRN